MPRGGEPRSKGIPVSRSSSAPPGTLTVAGIAEQFGFLGPARVVYDTTERLLAEAQQAKR